MHEFSLCDSLVAALLEELAELGEPYPVLRAVRVRAGALMQIVPETMQYAFELSVRETIAEGAVLDLVVEAARAECRLCGWEGTVSESFAICPACDKPGLEMRTGREMVIENLEIEDHANQDDPSLS